MVAKDAKQKARSEKLAAKRRAAGLCPRCGSKVPSGYTTCDACRAKNHAANNVRRKERKAAGVCTWCASPDLSFFRDPNTGKIKAATTCEKHTEYSRIQNRKQRSQGQHD